MRALFSLEEISEAKHWVSSANISNVHYPQLLQNSAIIPAFTGIFKSLQKTRTESSAWVGGKLIQGLAKGRQRASQSHMRHACDALVPEILETRGSKFLGKESGFQFCNGVTILQMMRAKGFTG